MSFLIIQWNGKLAESVVMVLRMTANYPFASRDVPVTGYAIQCESGEAQNLSPCKSAKIKYSSAVQQSVNFHVSRHHQISKQHQKLHQLHPHLNRRKVIYWVLDHLVDYEHS